MSDNQFREFDTRLKRIGRTHRKLADGYSATLSSDGLLVAVPKRRRVRVPYLGIAVLAAMVIIFKGAVLAQAGSAAYDARVAHLSAGSTAERLGAWVLQADPLTQWVADRVGPVIN